MLDYECCQPSTPPGTLPLTVSSARIGFTFAQGLGRVGAKVVLNSRKPHKLALAAEQLRREDLPVHEMALHVTDSSTVRPTI